MQQRFSLFYISISVGLIIGAGVSVAANLFVSALGWLEQFRTHGLFSADTAPLLVTIEPVLWLGLGFVLVRLIAQLTTTDRWQGPADAIYTAHRTDMEMPVRQGVASMLAALVSLGSGASLGQYGPLVQMGGLFGTMLRRITALRWLSSDIVIGCGVAAAVSAAFQAPIAGILFAHEAVLRHFSARAITPIAIASITAAFSGQWMFGGVHVLRLDIEMTSLLMNVPFLLIGGMIFGALAIAVMMLHFKVADWVASSGLSGWIIGAAGVFMLGSLGVFVPQTLGLGIDVISEMLSGQVPAALLVQLLIAKIAALIIASTCGFVGGFVSPALFIGAAAGGVFSLLCHLAGFEVSVLMMMIAGMAAVSATIVGAPIAMVMLVFELTESYDFAVAAMLSVVVASFLSHISFGHSLFDQQLQRRNISLSKGRSYLELSARSVEPIISLAFEQFQPDTPIAAVRAQMVQREITEAYCIDDRGHYVGKIYLIHLIQADADAPVLNVVRADEITIPADADLQQAIEIASGFVGEAIAVLSADGVQMLGVVTEGDLFDAYLKAQRDIQRIEHG